MWDSGGLDLAHRLRWHTMRSSWGSLCGIFFDIVYILCVWRIGTCQCICIHVHICMCVCVYPVCTHTHTHTCTYTLTYIHACVCVRVCVSACVSRTCMHMYVCLCMCSYVCVFVCVQVRWDIAGVIGMSLGRDKGKFVFLQLALQSISGGQVWIFLILVKTGWLSTANLYSVFPVNRPLLHQAVGPTNLLHTCHT